MDLFDLNDYEEVEETPYEERKEEEQKKKEIILNDMELKEASNEIKVDIEKPISVDAGKIEVSEGLDDSFETKITLSANKNLKSSEAREKCHHAVDDSIDIKEFDKIQDLAMPFPFELDIFQKRSIIRLENHQNVLVCAHTSSGKTVIAEYAISLGKKLGKRVFYTSPIKALSNQKYREFKQKFKDVGILTGDVSINSDAQCVIMTTEILQSSLYKNSEMLNMVEWVVFDEVHFINDNERGHVWEEILILLPPRIGIVMLSATIPNYLDFAKWVGRIKNTTIYIQNTLKRIVPLEHKIFISTKQIFVGRDKSDKVLVGNINAAMKELENLNQKEYKNKNNPKTKKEREQFEAKKMHQIKDFFKDLERKEKENFNRKASSQVQQNNLQQIQQGRQAGGPVGMGKGNTGYGSKGGNNFGGGGGNNFGNWGGNNYGNGGGYNYGGGHNKNKVTMTHMKIDEMVTHLFKNDLTPAVIFVFSIKKIDEYARYISTEPRVSRQESNKIIKFFDKCMSKLSDEDKKINQIQVMRRILPQGIGVHHAGLLPILKETIELLYSKGLIKILFATTSFSIGLNMPTRTVVFSEIQKFNEDKKEILSSSEYLQMCGRAGRRGIDALGHIFLLMGDKKNPPLASDIATMMAGVGTHVESKFRLSYRTIISFLSRNIKNIMEFFKESYLENNKIMIMPDVMKEIADIHQKLRNMDKVECLYSDTDEYIRRYFQDCENVTGVRRKLYSIGEINKTLIPGKVIVFNSKKLKKDIVAVMLQYYQDYDQYRCLMAENNKNGVIEYEQNLKKGAVKDENEGVLNGKYYKYFEVYLDDIVDILDYKIKIDSQNYDWNMDNYCFIKKKDLDKALTDILEAAYTVRPKPVDYNKLSRNEITAFELVKEKNQLQNSIRQNKCHDCFKREEHRILFEERKALEDKFAVNQNLLKSENLKYYNDFQNRVNILKKLGYIDQDDQIELKGKAARELATSDCVLITELLMSNILDKLEIAETVAFLCGFAFNKNEIEIEDPQINDNFTVAVNEFKILFDGLVELEKTFEFEESKYNRRITFSVSKAIYLWMNGSKFREILQESDLEEGKLYNLIMRLYLFLEEIKNFYETLGNSQIGEKFKKAKEVLMRDIMSCRSLYLQEDIDIDTVDD